MLVVTCISYFSVVQINFGMAYEMREHVTSGQDRDDLPHDADWAFPVETCQPVTCKLCAIGMKNQLKEL